MIYGDNPIELTLDFDESVELINRNTLLPVFPIIVQSNNGFVYCGNNPIAYTDLTGQSYTNSIKKIEDNTYSVTTTIKILWKKLKYKYTIKNGIVLFDFDKNDYGAVFWRGGAKQLAKAMFEAAKSISKKYLSGRTVGGINTELQLHWAAYSVGFMTKNASPADIGGMTNKPGYGYDPNAWFFQGVQAGKVAAKIVLFGVFGMDDLLREVIDYLR